MAAAQHDEPTREQAGDRTKRRLETIAGTIGAALTLATLGVLIYDVATGEGRPPAIVVEPGETRVVEGRYLVEIDVRNTGDRTAAAVVVEGALLHGDEVVELREVELDYVSPRAEHGGALVFSRDPAQYQLELHAKSWTDP